ncbi:hypothetical protein C8R47DRAFT_96810 [Mycena vitilis]|nr:hypothetical protein C8R47DRAFT_96810 [Mycena vitilis]
MRRAVYTAGIDIHPARHAHACPLRSSLPPLSRPRPPCFHPLPPHRLRARALRGSGASPSPGAGACAVRCQCARGHRACGVRWMDEEQEQGQLCQNGIAFYGRLRQHNSSPCSRTSHPCAKPFHYADAACRSHRYPPSPAAHPCRPRRPYFMTARSPQLCIAQLSHVRCGLMHLAGAAIRARLSFGGDLGCSSSRIPVLRLLHVLHNG